VETAAGHVVRSAPLLNLSGIGRIQAPPQAAYSARWQSREEYDAFKTMTQQRKNPEVQIALAEAFLQRFPRSDFRSGAYLTEMRCYYQLNKIGPSVDAARKALRFDRDNLEALTFLSYVFPFTFQADSPAARSILTIADNDARHGLDALQRFQKPANVAPEQFQTYVKAKRAIFNSAVGFVALQRNDYANAIAALKAAVADNPSDVLPSTGWGWRISFLHPRITIMEFGIWPEPPASPGHPKILPPRPFSATSGMFLCRPSAVMRQWRIRSPRRSPA